MKGNVLTETRDENSDRLQVVGVNVEDLEEMAEIVTRRTDERIVI